MLPLSSDVFSLMDIRDAIVFYELVTSIMCLYVFEYSYF